MEDQTQGATHANRDDTLLATLPAFEQHMREEGFARNTIKSFASDVRLLASYYPEKKVNDISTEDLNKFLNWLLNERGVPCSPKSYARRVTTIKVLFGWLRKSDSVVINPAEAVVQASATSPLPTIPTEVELEKSLEVAKAWTEGQTIEGKPRKRDTRPLALLSLLLQTGGKKGEIKGIHLEQILRDDDENPEIFIKYANPRMQYKERKVAIDPEWLPLADAYIEQYKLDDELFTCTPRNLEYILRDIGDEAGLSRGLLSFENLRWAAALRDLKEGIEPDLIREKLGLSKITWRETKSKLEKLKTKEQEALAEAEV